MSSGEAPHVDLRVTYFTPYSYLFPTHSRPPFPFLGSPLPFFPWLVIEAVLHYHACMMDPYLMERFVRSGDIHGMKPLSNVLQGAV